MLKKVIKYTDYNGQERSEVFCFNMSKAELMEMELGTEGGLGEAIRKIIQTQDTPTLVKIFKEWILKAYGEKSADGRRFIKSEELSTAFSQTEAYSNLFMELATNAEAAAEFMNGIIPADVAEDIPKTQEEAMATLMNDVAADSNKEGTPSLLSSV